MVEKLEKRLKRIRFYEIMFLGIVILLLFCEFKSVLDKKSGGAFGGLIIIVSTIYLVKHYFSRRKKKQIEYLLFTDKGRYIEDISFENRTFLSSDIYCGKYGFCKGKNGIPILYKNILWIYEDNKKYGNICHVNVRLVSGERIVLRLNEEDATKFLDEYIIPDNPDIVRFYLPRLEEKYNGVVAIANKNYFYGWDDVTFSVSGSIKEDINPNSNNQRYNAEYIENNLGREKFTLFLTVVVAVFMVVGLIGSATYEEETEDVIKNLKAVSYDDIQPEFIYFLEEGEVIDFYYRKKEIVPVSSNENIKIIREQMYYIASYVDEKGEKYYCALECPYYESKKDDINAEFLEAQAAGKWEGMPLSGNFVVSKSIESKEEFEKYCNEHLKDSEKKISELTLRPASQKDIEEAEEDLRFKESEDEMSKIICLFVPGILISVKIIKKKKKKIIKMKEFITDNLKNG